MFWRLHNILTSQDGFAGGRWKVGWIVVSHNNRGGFKNRSNHSGMLHWVCIPQWILELYPITWCPHIRIAPLWFGDRSFSDQREKSCVATQHNTVNDEFDWVEWTGWCAYIPRVAYLTTCDSDARAIRIFLVRFDLADNHGVENFVSSALRDICELDESEGVCAFHALVPWAFWNFSYPLTESAKFISVWGVPNLRKLWVLTQLAVLQRLPGCFVEDGHW